MMLPEGTFDQKTILITGGGTGLGKSMAHALSALGANIIITSRSVDVLQKTAEEITAATGNPVLAIGGDVRKMEDVERVLMMGSQAFGTIHGLINNAAGNFISPTERLSHRAFESVIGIVLQGSVNYSLALGKQWIKDEVKGTVLSIVTTYAWTGTGYTVPSSVAKAGVFNLTRSLAVEWGRKYGIRFNSIAPGPFPTKGAWDRLFPPSVKELIDPAKTIPLQRVGKHEELTNLVSYLMSDYAAYINGSCVTIDGGEWLEGAGMFSKFSAIPDDMWDTLEDEIRNAKRKGNA